MTHAEFKATAARKGWAFIPSHDVNTGRGDVAVPETWENEDGVSVSETELKHILFGDEKIE